MLVTGGLPRVLASV